VVSVWQRQLGDPDEVAAQDQRVARAYNAVFFAWHWTLMGLHLIALDRVKPGSTAVGEAIVRDLYDLPRWANQHAMEAWSLRHPVPDDGERKEVGVSAEPVRAGQRLLVRCAC
jgi:hypothetical protein